MTIPRDLGSKVENALRIIVFVGTLASAYFSATVKLAVSDMRAEIAEKYATKQDLREARQDFNERLWRLFSK